jgi:hypothetical protein
MSFARRFTLGFLFILGLAPSLGAQQGLVLEIQSGTVTLKAQNVPLRTILTEWARVGGTNVIGADRIAGTPITIELTGVSERQALDILLRNSSGYMLGLRPAGVEGVSAYNRILIMPPSTAPRALPVANPTAGLNRVQVLPPESPDDGNDDGPGGVGPVVRMPTVTGQNVPFPPSALPVPDADGPVARPQPGVVVTPLNPFGLPPGSSSTPGVVSPPPPQAPQRPSGN